MRPTHEVSSGRGSGTPIYDSLYAEYGRLFRTLPGDRSGEEELRFDFGTVHGTGTGHWGSGGWHSDSWRHDVLPLRTGQLPAALPPAPRDGHAYGL
ncbi:MAG: hypothetical protein ACRDP3_15055 [Streptomyces sp.]|uniref:hypothetical protein n=1 Tax=Streptomyces sp. TaxID=1931 RepID=UPI003D6BD394